jgi:hypothetical protein
MGQFYFYIVAGASDTLAYSTIRKIPPLDLKEVLAKRSEAHNPGAKNVRRDSNVWSDSSTMIATKARTALIGTRMA